MNGTSVCVGLLPPSLSRDRCCLYRRKFSEPNAASSGELRTRQGGSHPSQRPDRGREHATRPTKAKARSINSAGHPNLYACDECDEDFGGKTILAATAPREAAGRPDRCENLAGRRTVEGDGLCPPRQVSPAANPLRKFGPCRRPMAFIGSYAMDLSSPAETGI